MMTKASLISLPNLEPAWSRITTARNLQHKRMFRHLQSAYEPGRRANLTLLHEQLKGGWKATSPIRVFMPKSSGLLRPLTLLALDDQIVLQAIANVIAKQVFGRRRAVQGKSVFSNFLTADLDSIVFLQDWRLTYHLFKARPQHHLGVGNQWIAHFDLASTRRFPIARCRASSRRRVVAAIRHSATGFYRSSGTAPEDFPDRKDRSE